MSAQGNRETTAFFYYVSVSILTFLLTLIDVANFTLYLTFWLPALSIAVICVLLFCVNPTRIRAIFLSLLLAWVMILPHVRWNRTKSFFIDARRLHTGMTEVQARSVMKPYLKFEYNNNIKFKPYEGGGDMCVIHLKDGKVIEIRIGID